MRIDNMCGILLFIFVIAILFGYTRANRSQKPIGIVSDNRCMHVYIQLCKPIQLYATLLTRYSIGNNTGVIIHKDGELACGQYGS